METNDNMGFAYPAEILAEINRHKWFLSQEAGQDVGFDAARRDWLEHHLEAWQRQRQEAMLALQRDEINRHKWIESEKAQRDLGREACLDWIRRYAAQWREWYETQYEASKP